MSFTQQNPYKVVVVGSAGVGKTTLVHKLTTGIFMVDSQSTVGVEFKLHEIHDGDEIIQMNIWDTAGQEKFRSVAKSYFRNAIGAILTFALNNHNSFNELDAWLNDLQTLCAPNAVILLIGNKSDLKDERYVPETEIKTFAERHNIDYIETSACSGQNVQETFLRLARSINEKVKSGELNPDPSNVKKAQLIDEEPPKEKSSGCC